MTREQGLEVDEIAGEGEGLFAIENGCTSFSTEGHIVGRHQNRGSTVCIEVWIYRDVSRNDGDG